MVALVSESASAGASRESCAVIGTISGASRMSSPVYVRNSRDFVFDLSRRFEFIAAGLSSPSPFSACAVSTSAMLTFSPSTTSAASMSGPASLTKSARFISPSSQFLKTPPCPSASSLPWPVTSSIWSIVTFRRAASLHSSLEPHRVAIHFQLAVLSHPTALPKLTRCNQFLQHFLHVVCSDRRDLRFVVRAVVVDAFLHCTQLVQRPTPFARLCALQAQDNLGALRNGQGGEAFGDRDFDRHRSIVPMLALHLLPLHLVQLLRVVHDERHAAWFDALTLDAHATRDAHVAEMVNEELQLGAVILHEVANGSCVLDEFQMLLHLWLAPQLWIGMCVGVMVASLFTDLVVFVINYSLCVVPFLLLFGRG
eukprot:7390426-Prymnesium_polylepis.2